MNRIAAFAAVALAVAASPAYAEDPGWSVTLGTRLWYTQWTTFSYYSPGGVQTAMTEVSAPDRLVVMPVVSVRHGDVFASASAFASTHFSFDNNDSARRSEFDATIGWSVLPGLVLTLGWKGVSQTDGDQSYRPHGPVVGASANAPLGSGLSLYGSLGIGWLKTPVSNDPKNVNFHTGYRLAEVGLAYPLNSGSPTWTATGGYRIQVMSSKDAFTAADGHTQDGRDTTQGFTLGVNATF